jgi:DNA polymerase-1
MTWVAEGGQVWDCQLAEYLLEGMVQQAHMLSLDEVAPRYGGQLKFDEVKALWQAGVQTDDIEPKLLLRYLCGEGTDLGDVGNTLKIAQAQIARARDVRAAPLDPAEHGRTAVHHRD